MKKINVMYINFSLHMGGIETMIVDFLNGLSPDEFNASVAVFNAGGNLEPLIQSKGFKVFDLNKNEGIDIKLIFKLRKLIKEQKIDVIHTNNFGSWFYAIFATFFNKHTSIVHTEHSIVTGNKKRRFLAERLFSIFTTNIVTVSEDVKQNMVRLCGIKPGKILVITNGVDISKFNYDKAQRDMVRRELRLGDRDILIGTVGRLVPVKDHLTLIHSFSKLHDVNSTAHLIIVGDGPEKKLLQNKILELNLVGNVHLLGERNDIVSILSSLDIYVVSSISEGMSISILEAMSCGLPVVATDVGGNPELIKDGLNGVLVPPQQPDELFEQMHNLVLDFKLREKMSLTNKNQIKAKFNNQMMIEKYKLLYENCMPAL